MRKLTVIKHSNLPARLPIVATIAWYLFLEHLDVGGVAWGVFYTVAGIVWAAAIVCLFIQSPRDIFKEGL